MSNSLPLGGSILAQAVLHKEVVRPAKLLGLFLVLLLASPAAQPADAGAKEKELRELRGRIEALQKRLADAEGTKRQRIAHFPPTRMPIGVPYALLS